MHSWPSKFPFVRLCQRQQILHIARSWNCFNLWEFRPLKTTLFWIILRNLKTSLSKWLFTLQCHLNWLHTSLTKLLYLASLEILYKVDRTDFWLNLRYPVERYSTKHVLMPISSHTWKNVLGTNAQTVKSPFSSLSITPPL